MVHPYPEVSTARAERESRGLPAVTLADAETPQGAARVRQLALTAVFVHTAIAAATSFVAKATLNDFSPFSLALLRLVGASAFAAPVVALRRHAWRRVPTADRWRMAALGLLGVTLNQTLFLTGLTESTPARSALLYALSPTLILVIGRLRGTERLSTLKVAGLVGAFGGVSLILADRISAATSSLRGDLTILAGVLCWSLYSVLGRRLLRLYDPLVVACVGLIGGTVAYLPVGLWSLSARELSAASFGGWLGVAFMAIFSSVVGYSLWYAAIRRIPASQAAVVTNLQPATVVLVSWAALGEPISSGFILGAALVLAGVLATNHRAGTGPAA
jgi:drug/metabolite transporter (DMT)-like permease